MQVMNSEHRGPQTDRPGGLNTTMILRHKKSKFPEKLILVHDPPIATDAAPGQPRNNTMSEFLLFHKLQRFLRKPAVL